jgi:hypothetical protein
VGANERATWLLILPVPLSRCPSHAAPPPVPVTVHTLYSHTNQCWWRVQPLLVHLAQRDRVSAGYDDHRQALHQPAVSCCLGASDRTSSAVCFSVRPSPPRCCSLTPHCMCCLPYACVPLPTTTQQQRVRQRAWILLRHLVRRHRCGGRPVPRGHFRAGLQKAEGVRALPHRCECVPHTALTDVANVRPGRAARIHTKLPHQSFPASHRLPHHRPRAANHPRKLPRAGRLLSEDSGPGRPMPHGACVMVVLRGSGH